MFVAILVILCALFWIGMVCLYFQAELIAWLDNRFGPESKDLNKPKPKPFWRFYG